MLTLDADTIHLWHFELESNPLRMDAQYLDWLSPAERNRHDRLLIANRRQHYLLGKIMQRQILSHYEELEPRDWQFEDNAWGKPAVALRPDPGLHFNLSHSGNAYVMAVARHGELGVDIEFAQRGRRVSKLAGRYFSAQEAHWLLAQEASRQQELFYDFWTLKEAYIKARGMGLALSLDGFSFDVSQAGKINFAHHDLGSRGEHDDEDWRFWRIKWPGVSEDYALALAVAAKDSQLFGLKAYRFGFDGVVAETGVDVLAASR